MNEHTWVTVGRIIAATALMFAVYGFATLLVVGRADFITRDYYALIGFLAIGFGALTWAAVPNQPRNRAVWVAAVAALFAGLSIASLASAQ